MADPIAPTDTRYFIGPEGDIVSADPANAAVYSRSSDYVEASPEQAQDAQLQAKYGGAGQQAKTILEGVARGATLGLSTPIETGLGIATPEDIAGRQHVNPWESAGSEMVGVALPSVLSGGAAAPEAIAAEGAGLGAREAVAQGARYLPAAVVRRAGQAVTEGLQGASAVERGLSGVAPTLAERVLSEAGAHAVGSSIETIAYGLGHVVHEKALGDPNLTAQSALAEIGFSALVGGALGAGVGAISEGVPGIMSKLTGAGAESESLAQKEALWTAQSVAGGAPIRREFDYLEKSLGRANAEKLIREMGSRGIDSPFASLRVKDARADSLMSAAKIGDLVDQASNQLPRMEVGDLFSEVRDDILKPINDNKWSAAQSAARKFGEDLTRHETDIGTRGGATLRDLYDLRIDTDKAIDASGGFDGPDAFYNGALRDFRKKLNDRIKGAFSETDIPREVYEERLRMYQVGRAAKDFTRAGLNAEYNGARGGVGGGLGFLGTGMIVHALGGGLPGTIGAYVGIGALRRYAPGILAAAARKLRQGATRGEVAADLQKTVQSMVDKGAIPTEPPPVHPITGEPLGEVVPRSASPFVGAQPNMAGAQTMMGAPAVAPVKRSATDVAHAEFEAVRDRIAAHPSMEDEAKQRIVMAAMKRRDAKLDDIEELDRSSATVPLINSAPTNDAEQAVADQTAKDIAGQRQSAVVQPQPTPIATTANVPLPSMGTGAPVMPDPTAVAPTKGLNPADSLAENATSAPETVRALATLERNNQKVQSRIANMASTLVRMGPRAGSVARSEVLAGLSKSFAKSPEDARKQYNKRVEMVQRFGAPAMTAPITAPPVQPYIPAPVKGGSKHHATAHLGKIPKLHFAEGGDVGSDLDATPPGIESPPPGLDTLQRATFDMEEHAPVTAQALQQTLVRGMGYLQAQIPDTQKTAPLMSPRTPNRDEMSRFTRAWEAIEDPTQILKAAAAGTLQSDAVQAVQAVHPELLNAMRTTVLDKLATHGPPDRQARRAISVLMGEDMDGTGAMTGFNQSTYAAINAGQKPIDMSMAKPTGKGISALKAGSMTATEAQKVEALT